MAFGYADLDLPIELLSEAFLNPLGLEHLETAQQKRDQSKGQLGWSVSLAPLSLATPHLSPHVSSQLSLSLSLHYLPLSYYRSPLEKYTKKLHR